MLTLSQQQSKSADTVACGLKGPRRKPWRTFDPVLKVVVFPHDSVAPRRIGSQRVHVGLGREDGVPEEATHGYDVGIAAGDIRGKRAADDEPIAPDDESHFLHTGRARRLSLLQPHAIWLPDQQNCWAGDAHKE